MVHFLTYTVVYDHRQFTGLQCSVVTIAASYDHTTHTLHFAPAFQMPTDDISPTIGQRVSMGRLSKGSHALQIVLDPDDLDCWSEDLDDPDYFGSLLEERILDFLHEESGFVSFWPVYWDNIRIAELLSIKTPRKASAKRSTLEALDALTTNDSVEVVPSAGC